MLILHLSAQWGCNTLTTTPVAAEDPQLRPELLESNRAKRLKATVHFHKNNNFDLLRAAAIPKDADDASATASKLVRNKQQKPMKLSTAVAPLPQAAHQSSRADAQAGTAALQPTADTDARAHEGQKAPAAVPSCLAGLHPVMQAYLAQNSFSEPTEIQRCVWPLACSGKDVVAQVRSPTCCCALVNAVSPQRTAGCGKSTVRQAGTTARDGFGPRRLRTHITSNRTRADLGRTTKIPAHRGSPPSRLQLGAGAGPTGL